MGGDETSLHGRTPTTSICHPGLSQSTPIHPHTDDVSLDVRRGAVPVFSFSRCRSLHVAVVVSDRTGDGPRGVHGSP